MAMSLRKDIYKDLFTEIKTKELYKTSKLVSRLTTVPVQPNKAIIGENAFSHEAGIHQDGILKKRITYEILKPQDVGFKGSKLVLGKLSGRHAFSERLKSMGYSLSEKELEKAFNRFKKLADKKQKIFDEDLALIVEDEIYTIPEKYKLVNFQVTSLKNAHPLASVEMKECANLLSATATGDGPIDACFKSIDKATKQKGRLIDYKVHAVTCGKDALGEASVKIKFKSATVIGRGSSTDVIEASILAYINAVNRLFLKKPVEVKKKIAAKKKR